jgi:3-hydroxyisobutyrate dehydrogenase-like beta-hydroxyacid dehydrogenase
MISGGFIPQRGSIMAMRIGFIGLGVMGTPMAGHLAKAGHVLTVLDLDRAKAERLAAEHNTMQVAATPREVAERSEIVVTMLPSGEYVRDVALGNDGLVEGFDGDGGELLIDTSSCEPWLTIATAKALAAKGIDMVDSATSGAEFGAKAASLVFMLGGTAAAVERARPVLEIMGKHQFHLGPVGAGHAMKSINNTITAMTLAATAEGLIVGKLLGLDPNVMTDVLNVSTGMSWITQTHIKQRITNRAFDDPFKLELMVKDIGIALELAKREEAKVPLWTLGQDIWQAADRAAGPGASVSELVRHVEREGGAQIEP